jgi:hypothetical protein
MGQVFLATSLAGRMVAVKVIHPALGGDPDFIRRFRREVDAAQRVCGMYTAPVVAAGIDDVPPWLATAFVSGPSLDQVIIMYRPLPVPALWRLGAGLAEALRAIHVAGLIHRDLKPGNVLLASDGPRVIDFGIARAITDTRLTATGSVVGTPSFMSPEQVEDQPISPASDIFSLGSVLAFAASGASPFSAGPDRPFASVMYRIVHGEPDLARVAGDVRELIAACLAKDPAARPDPGQVATYCAAAAERLGPLTTTFWPSDLAQVIVAQQEALSQQLQALQVDAGPQGNSPAYAGTPIATLSSSHELAAPGTTAAGGKASYATAVPMADSGTACADSGLDPTRANVARVYDYLLGGKVNFAADRAVADQIIATVPGVLDGVRVQRAVLGRVVRFLAGEAGIRQLLDIGSGLPTADNVHEIAQRVAPSTQVVYVDNDPVVLAHSAALLADDMSTFVANADLYDPQSIIGNPIARAHLDWSQPIGLILCGIVHYILDSEGPAELVGALVDALPPGSYVFIHHLLDTGDPASARLQTSMRQGLGRVQFRTTTQVMAMLGGLEPVPPGIVPVRAWRPDPATDPQTDHSLLAMACAVVARKP